MTAVMVMGPAACGKTTLAKQLAAATGARFVEGDDLHPQANVAKMAAGKPLDDADRFPWLDAIAERVAGMQAAGERVVFTCSALKRGYRDRLRQRLPGLCVLSLALSQDQAHARASRRSAHFMPAGLVASQYSDFEEPRDEPRSVILDAAQPRDSLLQQARTQLDAMIGVDPLHTNVDGNDL